MDVGHHVDVPRALPLGDGRRCGVVRIRIDGQDAGVRAEQIDRADRGLERLSSTSASTAAAFRDIHALRRAVHRCGNSRGLRFVEIDDDDVFRARAREPLDEGAADAHGTSGDDDDFAGDFHARDGTRSVDLEHVELRLRIAADVDEVAGERDTLWILDRELPRQLDVVRRIEAIQRVVLVG